MAISCCCCMNVLRLVTKLLRIRDILNTGSPETSLETLLCQMSSQRMSLKVIESSEIMSSQKVGAIVQPIWQIWAFLAFGSSFKARVERSVLQTVAHVYSDDQAKVPKYLFVFCSGG